MTTPHIEEPAEGPDVADDDPSPAAEPSNPDKTGASIDDRAGRPEDPADQPVQPE